MLHSNRTYIVAFALCFGTLAAWASVSSNGLESRKQEVLRHALAALGRSPDDPALVQASTRAKSLLDLQVYAEGERALAVIHTNGTPLYDAQPSADGRAFTLCFYDTLNLIGAQKIVPGGHSPLREVSGALDTVEPQFISRLAFKLETPCTPVVRQNDGQLEIEFVQSTSANASNPVATAFQHRVDRLTIERARIDERAARSLDALEALRLKGNVSDARFKEILSARDEALGALNASVEQTLTKARADAQAQLDAAQQAASQPAALAAIEKSITNDQRQFDEFARQCDRLHSEWIAKLEASQREATPSIPEPAPAATLSAPDIDLASSASFQTIQTTDIQLPWRDIAPLAAPADSPEAGPEDTSAEKPAEAAPAEEASAETETKTAAEDTDTSEEAPSEEAAGSDTPPATEPESTPATESAPGSQAPPAPRSAEGAEPQAESAPREFQKPVRIDSIQSPTEISKTAPAPRKENTGADPNTDPLYQLVSIDFRNMELSNVVALLAQKAGVNVIAGNDVAVSGTVTTKITDVPLIKAMEEVLRINGLGLIEEEGLYRITRYEDAVAARRTTRMITLRNAQAIEVQDTLTTVLQGIPDGNMASVAASETTNVLIVSGPEKIVARLEELAYQLDVAKPSLPTATEAIKLNYASPADVVPIVKNMLTRGSSSSGGGKSASGGNKSMGGTVEADERARMIIVTDLPVVIEQVRELIKDIDTPVKQVGIEAMIVNAVLQDESQTGVNWLLDLVKQRDSAGEEVAVLPGRSDKRGNIVGSIQDLNTATTLGNVGESGLDAGVMTFGVLTEKLDIRGAIAAEVASNNAEILANPVVVTVENKKANIAIVQDYPYQQLTQSTQGPEVASTAFKEIGIELNVTPRVTHENDILVDIDAKQSSINGLTDDGVPIEDKRTATTTLRTNDNRTIFIGGLRNVSSRNDVNKIPVLGDLPVVNFMFRNTDIEKTHTELLIFLTCRVINEQLPDLTPAQQVEYDKLSDEPSKPDSQRALMHQIAHPEETNDPIWKWRRTP